MKNPVRELTEKEKRRIRQLITQKCANFHEEYGCLPLDCAWFMIIFPQVMLSRSRDAL